MSCSFPQYLSRIFVQTIYKPAMVSSSTDAILPYRPGLNSWFLLPLIAVDTKMRSPQTIGLESPRPGMGVFQRIFSELSTFQVTGDEYPSATPFAFDPLNEGHWTFGTGVSTSEEKNNAASSITAWMIFATPTSLLNGVRLDLPHWRDCIITGICPQNCLFVPAAAVYNWLPFH